VVLTNWRIKFIEESMLHEVADPHIRRQSLDALWISQDFSVQERKCKTARQKVAALAVNAIQPNGIITCVCNYR
jgi:hypothetical protein